jgi:hypothetical protein
MCLAGNQDNVSGWLGIRIMCVWLRIRIMCQEWSRIMCQSGVMSKVRLAGNRDNMSEWSRIMCQWSDEQSQVGWESR